MSENATVTISIEIPKDSEVYLLCEQFAKDNSDIEFLNTTEKVMKLALDCGCFPHIRRNLEFFKHQAEAHRNKKREEISKQ